MKWSKRQLKMKLFLFLADMDFLFKLRRKKIPRHMFPKSRLCWRLRSSRTLLTGGPPADGYAASDLLVAAGTRRVNIKLMGATL